jgi:hypothetical protein
VGWAVGAIGAPAVEALLGGTAIKEGVVVTAGSRGGPPDGGGGGAAVGKGDLVPPPLCLPGLFGGSVPEEPLKYSLIFLLSPRLCFPIGADGSSVTLFLRLLFRSVGVVAEAEGVVALLLLLFRLAGGILSGVRSSMGSLSEDPVLRLDPS